MISIFRCPVCGEKLERTDNGYVCGKNHNFDLSKKGYVNLLLSGNMNSKLPGDNKLMVNARRDFLQKDFYRPMADALCETVCENFDGSVLLDAGCGEGYYTDLVSQSLHKKFPDARIGGIDISKSACAYAARKCPAAEIAVASIFRMPIADGGADLMMTLFAPCCEAEFRRIIRKDGIMIMVIPSPKHLWQLKAAVYDDPYPNEPHDYSFEGFDFLGKKEIAEKIVLDSNEDIRNLFTMTPYYYKTGVEGHKRVENLERLETDIGFEILIYKRKT